MSIASQISRLFDASLSYIGRATMNRMLTAKGTASSEKTVTAQGGAVIAKEVVQKEVLIGDQTVINRVERLLSKVHSTLCNELPVPVQEELAECVGLLSPIERMGEYSVVGMMEIAISALLQDKPNVDLAKRLRERAARRIDSYFYRSVLRPKSPVGRVILGLGLLFYFVIPIIFLIAIYASIPETILGVNLQMLFLVGVSGALGSIVSILVRINDFALLKNTDPTVLFLTGFSKPIIGTAFAMFVFAFLNSGLTPVTIQTGKETFFFLTLSFIAGFSERFAKDVASQVEKTTSATFPSIVTNSDDKQ